MSTPTSVTAGHSASSWAGRLTFQWHGAALTVRSNDAAALDELAQRLPHGALSTEASHVAVLYSWTVSPSHTSGHALHVVSRQCAHHTQPLEIARTADATAAAGLIVHDAEFRVALHAPERLFVHAAAVEWEGRVIVLPAPSLAGKSTLAAALVRAGAAYFSDEYAVIDEHGLVHPFPRRLHLRSPSGGAPTEVHAEELGGVVGTGPLPLGMIVSTTFHDGGRWNPRPMSAGNAALALLDNAVVARIRPAHSMARIARALAHGAVGVASPRGEADDTARQLLALASQTFAAAGDRPSAS